MLISEVEAKLKELRETFGDVPAVVDDDILDLWEVSAVVEGSILGCFLNNAQLEDYDTPTPCVILA